MKKIFISITKWQHDKLSPLFEKLENEYKKTGKRGGLHAQLWEAPQDSIVDGFLEVQVVNNKECEAIQAVFNVKPGKEPDKWKLVNVLIPPDMTKKIQSRSIISEGDTGGGKYKNNEDNDR